MNKQQFGGKRLACPTAAVTRWQSVEVDEKEHDREKLKDFNPVSARGLEQKLFQGQVYRK